jgi:thiamine-phosphate pyrophosphorylase
VARQLCDGGSDLIQLRAKGASSDTICRLAEEILPILRQTDVGLVINDHPALASKLGADLCHLGQEDFFDVGWTSAAQFPCPIGLSTHAPAQAERSIAAGPTYIAIGPVYATPTKPTAHAVTLEYVRWAAAHVPIPWFAIGGINLKNLDEVLQAGAQRICVVSAILQASDLAVACREFRTSVEARQ